MFDIETALLLLLQEYAPCVREIVPELQQGKTQLSYSQLVSLAKAGASIDYLVRGVGSMFNRTPTGLNLRQRQFEKRLHEMLNNNSISIMPEEATTHEEQHHD